MKVASLWDRNVSLDVLETRADGKRLHCGRETSPRQMSWNSEAMQMISLYIHLIQPFNPRVPYILREPSTTALPFRLGLCCHLCIVFLDFLDSGVSVVFHYSLFFKVFYLRCSCQSPAPGTKKLDPSLQHLGTYIVRTQLLAQSLSYSAFSLGHFCRASASCFTASNISCLSKHSKKRSLDS